MTGFERFGSDPRVSSTSRHFEVVDARDRLVGNVRHATRTEAQDLRDALAGVTAPGSLAIAEVTERTVVFRDVTRV